MKMHGQSALRWTGEVEEGLKIMGKRNWHTVASGRRMWRKTVLGKKIHS
jgi:hypothetical protein